MKKSFTLLVFLFIATEAYPQFTFLGLSHTKTTDLTRFGDTLYASTQDGIFKRSVFAIDTNWMACGMQGNHVVQTLIPDHSTLISLVEIDSSFQNLLYKSTDSGNSFSLLCQDTSTINNYQFLNQLAHPEGNYDTLYLLSQSLRTFDGGLNWTTLSLVQNTNRFITVDPSDHSRIIFGGETFILSPFIQVSEDFGDSWNFPMMSGFFGGDNCVHDMEFDGNEWYAAGEGVICKTTDGGESWIQLQNSWSFPPQFSLYNFDIEISQADKNNIYVTGTNNFVTEVPLILSMNKGIDWDTISFPAAIPGLPEMNCLTVVNMSSHERVYLGGNGIYSYDNVPSRIKENSATKRIGLYPNPAGKELHISIDTKIFLRNDFLSLRIIDALGREVYAARLYDEENTISLHDLPSNLYFVCLLDDKSGRVDSEKLLVKE